MFSSGLVLGVGGRTNQNNYSSKELWGYMYKVSSNLVDESLYFVGNTIESVKEWLGKNNLSSR